MRFLMSKRLSLWCGAAWLAMPLSAVADPGDAAIPPVVSRHQIPLDGKSLAYLAEAGLIPIRDAETAAVQAQMFYTSYRAESAKGPRPVTFLWGGGPGGSSMIMDYTLAGPVLAIGGSPGKTVPNANTLLRDTDLVFVDQVGAGWSRVADRKFSKGFDSTIGDTDSFAEFIRVWRIRHDAVDRPVVVGGVSWGAPRAATVAYALLERGIPVEGVIMASGESSINRDYIDPNLFEAMRVPGMAEIAFRWQKLSPALGEDIAKIKAEATTWAQTVYFPALNRVAELTPAERDEVVAGLSRYVGLSPLFIDRTTLRILPRRYAQDLLRPEGKKLSGADLRVTEIKPSGWQTPALKSVREDLGWKTDLPYIFENEDYAEGFVPFRNYPEAIGDRWDFATSPSDPAQVKTIMEAYRERGGRPPTIGKPLPATEEAVDLNPGIRFLIIIDRFDGESTCESNAVLQRALPEKLKRALDFRCYEAGHTFWRTPGMAAQFRQDVHDMIGGMSLTSPASRP